MSKPLVRSAEERRLDIIAVHSDLWETGAGWVWEADHPSGWSAQGVASSPEEALAAVEAAVAEGIEEGIGGVTRVLRPHTDG